jgi:hypothetical protein
MEQDLGTYEPICRKRTKMSPSPPPSPPTSLASAGSRHPFLSQPSPFSPSFHHGVVAEELPEWLLFSPSSSERWSGRPSSASLAPSFVDVVRHKSSAAPVGEGSSAVAPDGRPSSRLGLQAASWGSHREGKTLLEGYVLEPPRDSPPAMQGGFMTDAYCACGHQQTSLGRHAQS